MTKGTAGELDKSYGEDGIAPIPAPGFEPDVNTLVVGPVTADSDYSVACFGYPPGESYETGLFTRLLPDGQWDEQTGFVSFPDVSASLPLLTDFETLVSIGEGEQEGYLAVSRPYHAYDNGEGAQHAAVARLDKQFKPLSSFGVEGISAPLPPGLNNYKSVVKNRFFNLSPLRSARSKDYRGLPNIGFTPDKTRILFTGHYYKLDGDINKKTYILLLESNTGKPIQGLGPEEKESLYLIPSVKGKGDDIEIFRSHFLADGSLLLLSEEGDQVFLTRYNSKGERDPNFNDIGYREFNPRGRLFGMHVNDSGEIWISTAPTVPTSNGQTFVYKLDATGKNDPKFNNGDVVKLASSEGSLRLDHLHLDSQNRIILAGARLFTEGQFILSKMQLVRLLPDGQRDPDFGKEGFALEHDYISAANGLYVTDDGIRILGVLASPSNLYEFTAKYQSD